MSLPLLLRVSKSCPRLLINMEKAGQVTPHRLYHLASAFVLAVFVCVSVIHAVCVCAPCAGWSSARVARFWWRDGLWLWQGIQVPQRWFFCTILHYIKWAKNHRIAPFHFLNTLYLYYVVTEIMQFTFTPHWCWRIIHINDSITSSSFFFLFFLQDNTPDLPFIQVLHYY